MKLLYSIALLGFLIQGTATIGTLNLLGSVANTVTGVVPEIPNVTPSPEDLFTASKEILFALPETALFETISTLCEMYKASNIDRPLITADFDSMSLRLHTRCKESTFLLNNAENILQSPDFDVTKKVAIFVTGWIASSEADYVFDMANAFNCRGDYNFLALNSSDSIQTLYTWSAFNTEEVGRRLANALAKLAEQVPTENIHLIGHSLGSHIVGYAARYFANYTGMNISHVTGLDPANPCFNEGQCLAGLQRGDAEFVDIIHTNPNVLGKANPIGDADFYTEGLDPIKPGCYMFPCSHLRAYEYYTETVYPGNEQNFLGVRCTSLMDVQSGFCNGPGFPMGFNVPFNMQGNYFLSVNGGKPYGQNSNGRSAVPSQCVQVCA